MTLLGSLSWVASSSGTFGDVKPISWRLLYDFTNSFTWVHKREVSQFDGHAATAKENSPLNEQTEKSAHIKQTNYQGLSRLKLFYMSHYFVWPSTPT